MTEGAERERPTIPKATVGREGAVNQATAPLPKPFKPAGEVIWEEIGGEKERGMASSSSSDSSEPMINLSVVMTASGCLTVLLASALAYVLLETRRKKQEAAGEKAVEEETNVAPKVDLSKYPAGQLTVYYGTQTGTAESFARELEREGANHGFFVHVVDLEDVQVEDLVKEDADASRAIFLTATYGEGEPPDNATVFVQALKQKAGIDVLLEEPVDESLREPECLKGLEYCVFGLGNRQYDHYNAMGKFFDKALELAGGKRVLPIGMGNDDDDLEGDFETWKDQRLWPLLLSKRASVLQRELSAVNKAHRLPDCQYKITYHDNKATSGSDVSLDKVHSSSRHYFTAVDCPVTTVRELRSSQDPGSTVHVEVDISKHKQLTYQTADNLGVLPVNSNTTVEKVAKALQYDLDAVFSLSAADNHEWHGAPFPMPCTVRECLTQYCDLQGALRRSDLKLLAAYCQDSTDQKALQRMASKEGRAEYKEKILESFVGLADLLEKCPSISMPLEHFINACPPLQSRFFTISSSSSVHPDTIHLTVSVTQHERKDGSFFKGLCSNYLASRKPSTHTIRVFHRPSTFRLPADASRPLIMIGPGTGIAPMRALLQERSYQRTKRKMNVGSNILYFGCKRRSEDFLYEDELKQFQQDGVLDVLRVAFSREQDQKVYVQHLLLQNAEETWNLIDGQKAHIFVCGGVKMGQDVSEALKEIVVSHSDLSSNAAKEYLSKLSHEGRFVQELWA